MLIDNADLYEMDMYEKTRHLKYFQININYNKNHFEYYFDECIAIDEELLIDRQDKFTNKTVEWVEVIQVSNESEVEDHIYELINNFRKE